MACSRCGNNRSGGQIPLPPMQRPGTIPAQVPQPPVQPVRVNPSDAVRNAITGLRYVPRG